MNLDLIRQSAQPAETKIVLVVMDGLGGIPRSTEIVTELEAASTPHLDSLASRGICGLHQPIGPGITPGSGPSHLALFGYDPIAYPVGRGVLAALGINFDLKKEDLAARGNFCTVDEACRVTDRRAGRISTERCMELCDRLREIRLPDTDISLQPVKDYRFLLVLRADGLSPKIGDTDPLQTGKKSLNPESLIPEAEKTARTVDAFLKKARRTLKDEQKANMILLRGFSKMPQLPKFADIFRLHAAAVASYPMYRGVAKLVGMDPLDTGETLADEIQTLESRWEDFDYFYLHIKAIDSAGEDGDFERKVSLIEEVDGIVPQIMHLEPDVVVVTGDHSTPAQLKSHSWHPVPVLLVSDTCRPDDVDRFGERACTYGALGPRYPAVDLMPLMLAHAGRMEKFGA